MSLGKAISDRFFGYHHGNMPQADRPFYVLLSSILLIVFLTIIACVVMMFA